jgi:DEAD/DEAH box helicase domain-containing protein
MSAGAQTNKLQLDALSTERALRRRLAEFAQSVAYLRDPRISAICRRLWESDEVTGGLVGQLWVEGIYPSTSSGLSLRDLAQEGVLTGSLLEQLDRTRVFPTDRALYSHQERSLRLEAKSLGSVRPAVVVTANTGAGKTEAFLLPMLNTIFRDHRTSSETGVRAIILYPMNALVNDQVERLYEWLKHQERVTLFHFTGETPEDDERARNEGYPSFERCRMRTREQARLHVPDILITNYSMLEYMLCRPQDAVFFGNALKTFVVDEAHIYNGTLAAEITFLMRRVLLRCGLSSDQILQIATSATLGDEVRSFAAKLFSKDIDHVHWIQGEAVRPPLPPALPPESPCRPEDVQIEGLENATFLDEKALVEEPIIADAARRTVAPLVSAAAVSRTAGEYAPARVLYMTLRHSPIISQLEDALWQSRANGILRLRELALKVWDRDDEESLRATARLLQLGSRARENAADLPLIPHKLHLMARAPVTVSVCMNPRCNAENNRFPGAGRIVTEATERCQDCGSATLTLCRCGRCGEVMFSGIRRDDNTLNLRPRWRSGEPSGEQYWYAQQAGEEGTPFDLATRLCEDADDSIFLHRVEECPNCGADTEVFAPVGFGDGLALPLVAETLLTSMPSSAGAKADWLPARGRRMLVFSDSRREAARLGPVLTRQHEVQLGRALINGFLEKGVADQRSLDFLQRDIDRLEQELHDFGPNDYLTEEMRDKKRRLASAAEGLPISRWRERIQYGPQIGEFFDRQNGGDQRANDWNQITWEKNRENVRRHSRRLLSSELASPSWRGLSLETLGLAEIVYPGIDSARPAIELLGRMPTARSRELLMGYWPSFLSSLLDTIRMDGAVTLGSEDADFNEYYFPLGSWVSREARFRSKLVPMIGKTFRSRRNAFCSSFLQACTLTPAQSEELCTRTLEAAFGHFLSLANSDEATWIEAELRETADGSAEALRLVFDHLYLRRPLTPHRCSITGEIWPRSVAGKSANANGKSDLIAVSHEDLNQDAKVGRMRRELAADPAFQIGIWSEEHSAQLESKENRRLQDLFSIGARNILSATTTLEVGIDIGGLSGVMLGNVPPGRANYQQRGGRAGRRSDGSSIVATYSRSNSYDLAVFQDFGAFFHKPLRKPTVLLGREPLGRRHLHSFLIGEFFRLIYAADTYVGAMRAFNSIGWLCGEPMIPVARSGEPRPERLIPVLYGGLRRPAEWWKTDSSVAEQFESFLSFHENHSSALDAPIRTLLSETPLADQQPGPLLSTTRDEFHEAWTDWAADYRHLTEHWVEIREDGRLSVMNALAHQANTMWRKTVIEELAVRRFLPRYGFPIGLQSLTSPNFQHDSVEPVSLERDGILAVSEYIPGSIVLAGGKTYASHGLVSFWGQRSGEKEFGIRVWKYMCLSGHVWYRNWREDTPNCAVPNCESVKEDSGKLLLVPKYGYSTAAWDPPSWSGNSERVGKTQILSTAFLTPRPDQIRVLSPFGLIRGLKATLCEGGELLASNSGESKVGFAICTKCGYAESEKAIGVGREKLPTSFELHIPLSKPKGRCWRNAEAPVLRNHHLAALQVTDLVEIDFTGINHPRLTESTTKTLGYALKLAGTEMLELDSREIGVAGARIGPTGSWGLQLFDSSAGGSGHVAELFGSGREWLSRAREVMFRDAGHNERCISACLRCLLISASQVDYEAGLLQRQQTINMLEDLLR